jgi:hypothetical protein
VNDKAAEVAGLLDQFDDRYLGSKATAPAVDNDGVALLVGALYWNSTENQMWVWSGGVWVAALTLSPTSVSTLTNKTIDNISNKIGANHVHYEARNNSGTTIARGTVVYAQGTQSGTDYIEIAPITNPQTQVAIGIAHASISNNGTGLVLNTGVEANLNTSAWPVGTILYPNTAGWLTSTKPASGVYQMCAYVMRQHSTQGTLLCEFTAPVGYVSSADVIAALNNAISYTLDMGGI